MLHGPGSECTSADGLLDEVRVKTALLRFLVDKAPTFRVVRCVGVESAMELAFAGLHELCYFPGRTLERQSLLRVPSYPFHR